MTERLEDRGLLAADVLFADSFEQGSNSNDWSGNWVEDSQDDWFRSTQRSTDGSYSAEVDGRANGTTLSMANPLDLTGYDSAELSFSWFIQRNWDSGEYLAVDVHNGGWQEVARLRGNVGRRLRAEVLEDPRLLAGDSGHGRSRCHVCFRGGSNSEIFRFSPGRFGTFCRIDRWGCEVPAAQSAPGYPRSH